MGGGKNGKRKLVFSGKAANALFSSFFGKKVVVAAAKKWAGVASWGVLLFFFGAVITQMEGRPKRENVGIGKGPVSNRKWFRLPCKEYFSRHLH